LSRATVALAALLTTSVLIAGCGGDDDEPTVTPTEDTTPLVACEPGTLEGVTVTGDPGAEPKVALDGQISVDKTDCAVLTEGEGDRAQEGDVLEFDYLLVNGRTGNTYASSYAEGVKASIPLDDKPIRGLRQALTGAQAGSRIVVVMSAEDGYGLQGGDPANDLQEDDSLVLVTDIVAVREVLTRAEGTPVTPESGLPSVQLGEDGRPTITVPQGDPPSALVVQPLIEGTGPVIQAGQTITAHYVGVIWKTGQEFDSSWEGTPIESVLKVATPESPSGLIAGWVNGLAGQKVGSQVMLVIPPADAYGEAGVPNAGIGATDTLVFVIDLLAAR
jgi:FKBP-type peptidyl-prolyl cis-trans isomerase